MVVYLSERDIKRLLEGVGAQPPLPRSTRLLYALDDAVDRFDNKLNKLQKDFVNMIF